MQMYHSIRNVADANQAKKNSKNKCLFKQKGSRAC